MVEISDDRGITFKSWKNYARFLELEVKKLQQLTYPYTVRAALVGAKVEAHRKGYGIARKVMADEPDYDQIRVRK